MIFSQDTAFSLMILSLLVALCRSAVFVLLRRRREGGGGNPHNGVHEDIISQLPDDILVSIIARTPTRFAVSTSILSKRWRNLYKSLSSFTLSCDDLVSCCTVPLHDFDCGRIIYRLERFLSLCSGSKVHYFQLRCCLRDSCLNQFEQCIYYLGKSGVEKLKLCLICDTRHYCVSFSCHLLSKLPSLKHLSLTLCSLLPNLNSKCSSLQTLNLSSVTLVPGSLECILSNCLGLRSLTIGFSLCPPKLCFCSPILQLNTLIIIHCEARNCVSSFSSNWKNTMPYVWGKLSEDLPHLESLTFETRGDFDQESIGRMSIGMETFSNLKRLDMNVCCSPRTNLLALTPFLESCPLLEEFHFDARNMEYDVAVQRKPVVFLHTKLKMVEITGFCGTDNEIEFALYILKTAIALEQMFVITRVRYYKGCGIWRKSRVTTPWKKETRNKIEKRLPGQAISKTAKLIILHESIFFTSIHHEVK